MRNRVRIEGYEALLNTLSGLPVEDRHALLIVGLSGVGRINRRHGFRCGDKALNLTALRLKAIVRDEDVLHRLAGDRFALIIRDVRGEGHAQLAARKIADVVKREISIGGELIEMHAHIAIAMLPSTASTDNLVRAAEATMRDARRAEVTVDVTSTERFAGSRDENQLEFDLDRAIQYGELVPWYQPIVEPRSGQIIGAEALLRWHSPDHGVVSPDRFLPRLENTGRVHDLTRHVVNAVLRDMHHLDADREYWFSVNASARNLRDRDFVEIVGDALAVWNVDATRLIVEITESALMTDSAVSIETVSRLCDMGIRVAIDDFGSGYSNMTYLKDLPAWELKIDKSLVTAIDKQAADRKIVRSIIQLARALQLRVVAEGIETAEVAAMVADLGCDYAQGYFYGRPMQLKELKLLMSAPSRLAV